MPFLLPIFLFVGGAGLIAGSAAFGSSMGTEAGKGLNNGLTLIGVATGVGIVIYALHKSGVKV
jgi:hypothetical protein